MISIHFDPQKIILFLKDHKDFFEKNNFFIYETIIGNKNGYCITYGKFNDLFSAKEAILSLPKKILDNKPYIRTFGGIKKEIKETIGSRNFSKITKSSSIPEKTKISFSSKIVFCIWKRISFAKLLMGNQLNLKLIQSKKF